MRAEALGPTLEPFGGAHALQVHKPADARTFPSPRSTAGKEGEGKFKPW